MGISKAAMLGLFAGALEFASTAHGEPQLQFSTGASYSNGGYGQDAKTNVLVAPFAARVSFGALSFKASIPYIVTDGPADVRVVLDDGGRGGSANGGTGSSASDLREGSRPDSSTGGGGGSDDNTTPGATRTDVQTFMKNRRVAGIGDASLSATYSLDAIAGTPVYLDLTGRVKLANGRQRDGLGVGATDYAAIVEVGVDGDLGSVFVSTGRRFLGTVSGARRVDGWQATVGGSLDIRDSVSIGISYDWREASTFGGTDPMAVDAYVAYQLTQSLKVEVDGGVGLSQASADYNVGLALTWRVGAPR